jgi:hypothetical protein
VLLLLRERVVVVVAVVYLKKSVLSLLLLLLTVFFFSSLLSLQAMTLEKECQHFKQLGEKNSTSLKTSTFEVDSYKAELERLKATIKELNAELSAERVANSVSKRELSAGLSPMSAEAEARRTKVASEAAVRSATQFHMDKATRKQLEFDARIKTLNDQISRMYDEMLMTDGEPWKDFYQRKYYDFLVLDSETGKPCENPHTGEAIPKHKLYERERNEAVAELEELKKKMTPKETEELLERVKLKTRQFKRKYKALKTFLHESEYMEPFDDKFCDVDKGNDEDSDDDIRLGGPREPFRNHHDVGLPFGFAARECAD